MEWRIRQADRELFARELEDFVPPRIFDAHAHLYDRALFGDDIPVVCAGGPVPADLKTYKSCISELIPGRELSGLFFGFPGPGVDFDATNRFVARQARSDEGSRAEMLIHPAMDPEYIRETVRGEGFAGLKPYHIFSAESPTFNASITDFLPEEQVRIADEEGLIITLHIVRDRALADASNQETIRRYASRYTNVRWILAHAARGFNPHHTVAGIGALRGLRNIWCDTSAVTECGAFEAIVRALGVDRLLYGSDFPVSHVRGRCVAIGDSFVWLSAENAAFDSARARIEPTLVGIESLRALRLACLNLQLSDTEIEAIFCGNMAEMLAG